MRQISNRVSDALVRFRAGPHGLYLVIDVLQYFNPPSAKTAAWRDCLSSVDQAGPSAWRPVPRVAVAAAQALVALAPRRAEVAVGQRHAAPAAEVRLRAVEVAVVARASLSAAPAREPHWSEAWFALRTGARRRTTVGTAFMLLDFGTDRIARARRCGATGVALVLAHFAAGPTAWADCCVGAAGDLPGTTLLP